ncbi:MAG: Exosome complex RNA-binding protein Rrp42 RNase PH superfamily [Candidatus Methanohalarchaeum thermophilum]|uniref:Exosome complex component Rrp42 n=1 Tax=Methanohalarchaeum thermophilum TaxID=1903181 RepID=A0A1Q6DVU1_METT1|nr:MAG: Exosome complex RNA-binding protein Rrp42 RNase PH superfamily [Candidatus Methanohalarchaeum thermophilum]
MDEEIIAEIEKDYIFDLIQKGTRSDERNLEEYRDINIETNYVKKADGSAKVSLGDTKVVTGVKMETGEPFEDTPDQGVLITNAELNAMASPVYEPGPPGKEATEISRVVDRGIRESEAIDLKSLCIEEGEEVWMVFVDVHVIDQGGNLFDVSMISAISALLTAEIPYEQYDKDPEATSLNINTIPVSCTALKCGNGIIYDPTYIEERIGETRLTVITDSSENIVGMQKGLGGSWTQEEIKEVVKTSTQKGKEIRKTIKSSI